MSIALSSRQRTGLRLQQEPRLSQCPESTNKTPIIQLKSAAAYQMCGSRTLKTSRKWGGLWIEHISKWLRPILSMLNILKQETSHHKVLKGELMLRGWTNKNCLRAIRALSRIMLKLMNPLAAHSNTYTTSKSSSAAPTAIVILSQCNTTIMQVLYAFSNNLWLCSKRDCRNWQHFSIQIVRRRSINPRLNCIQVRPILVKLSLEWARVRIQT